MRHWKRVEELARVVGKIDRRKHRHRETPTSGTQGCKGDEARIELGRLNLPLVTEVKRMFQPKEKTPLRVAHLSFAFIINAAPE